MRTTSPIIRNSPLTVTTSYERHTTSSPSRNYGASPTPRLLSESPVRYFSSTTTTSPLNLSHSNNSDSKINSETYKVTKHTYKTSTVNQSASPVFSSTKRIPSPGKKLKIRYVIFCNALILIRSSWYRLFLKH